MKPSRAGTAAEARDLADALEAYCAEHGLALSRVGVHLFGGARSGIKLLRLKKFPHKTTLDRVRAFLAAPPPPGLHRRPGGGPRIRRDRSTGEYLALKIEALIAAHDLSPHRVSVHLFKSNHGLQRLREQKPQRSTVERVEAFLEKPPLHLLRPLVVRPRRVFVRPVREKPRLTFEEQLALVAAGKVRIAPVLRVRSPEPAFTLGGVSAGML